MLCAAPRSHWATTFASACWAASRRWPRPGWSIAPTWTSVRPSWPWPSRRCRSSPCCHSGEAQRLELCKPAATAQDRAMQPQTSSTASALALPPAITGGEIPLIDISGYLAGAPGAAERAAHQLRFAFENVGFYYLAGHGVPQALIDTVYAEAARFHAQPIERKLALK